MEGREQGWEGKGWGSKSTAYKHFSFQSKVADHEESLHSFRWPRLERLTGFAESPDIFGRGPFTLGKATFTGETAAQVLSMQSGAHVEPGMCKKQVHWRAWWQGETTAERADGILHVTSTPSRSNPIGCLKKVEVPCQPRSSSQGLAGNQPLPPNNPPKINETSGPLMSGFACSLRSSSDPCLMWGMKWWHHTSFTQSWDLFSLWLQKWHPLQKMANDQSIFSDWRKCQETGYDCLAKCHILYVCTVRGRHWMMRGREQVSHHSPAYGRLPFMPTFSYAMKTTLHALFFGLLFHVSNTQPDCLQC